MMWSIIITADWAHDGNRQAVAQQANSEMT